MDDLEKAILISFDESGVSDLKSQAAAYIHQIKENPLICRICIDKLFFCKLVQVQFWCLQCLHEALRGKYSSISQEEEQFIRKSIFSMACNETACDDNVVRLLDSPPFIKNKLAQVVVTFIYFDYPSIWPSVFVDFMENLSKGACVIDMFIRVLSALDDELISLDYARSKDEVVIAGRIKDAMRVQCMPQIVGAWYDIVSMYRNSNPELCCNVLDCMRGYVAWIDIGLVINNAFTQLLFELMLTDSSPDQLRAAAAGVVLAAVSKRMDPKHKIALLQSLQIRRLFGLVTEDCDPILLFSVTSLLTGYATEVLECSQSLSSKDGKDVSVELLNEVLPSIFYVIQNCEVDSSLSIVQFLVVYVGTMKSLPSLTEMQMHHLGQILEVVRTQIRFDPIYRGNLDVLDKIGREEEDRMVDFRKDLFVLLRNIGRVAPDLTQIFIRNSLVSAVSSNAEEVEAALSLFYELGESLSDDAMKSDSLQELVQMLLSTKFTCHSNRLVALVYLDTITRYMKLLPENTQYVPIALHAFLDERGIHHPNVNVSRRASYLFMRAVKLLKPKLVPYIDKILQSLQDIIVQFTRMGSLQKVTPGSEDGSHIFEAIGLLIGMEEVTPEKQSNYLSAMLTPLCQQVDRALLNGKSQSPEESSLRIQSIIQAIMAINALSKGFNPRLVAARPTIALMFKQFFLLDSDFRETVATQCLLPLVLNYIYCFLGRANSMLMNLCPLALDVFSEVLVVFPQVEPLRLKITSFIHRMVDTLGDSIFPSLPKALEQLLTGSEPKELVDFLVLLNQLICKFGVAVTDMLEEVYPVIASKIFDVLQKIDIPLGPGSLTEEIRELQELQRTFFTFLQVIATHDLSSVFISLKSTRLLDPMMQLLLYSSCNHKDILIRKVCVQIFIRLIKDWYADPSGGEKVPGFQKFIIEAFALNCCLYSVLDKSFDFQDANTMGLFTEILTAQMVMYEKFGNDFLLHFVSKGFPSVHCTQDLAEQYCQKIQANDIKVMKSFYKSLIEKLRLQQNGSLDFR